MSHSPPLVHKQKEPVEKLPEEGTTAVLAPPKATTINIPQLLVVPSASSCLPSPTKSSLKSPLTRRKSQDEQQQKPSRRVSFFHSLKYHYSPRDSEHNYQEEEWTSDEQNEKGGTEDEHEEEEKQKQGKGKKRKNKRKGKANGVKATPAEGRRRKTTDAQGEGEGDREDGTVREASREGEAANETPLKPDSIVFARSHRKSGDSARRHRQQQQQKGSRRKCMGLFGINSFRRLFIGATASINRRGGKGREGGAKSKRDKRRQKHWKNYWWTNLTHSKAEQQQFKAGTDGENTEGKTKTKNHPGRGNGKYRKND